MSILVEMAGILYIWQTAWVFRNLLILTAVIEGPEAVSLAQRPLLAAAGTTGRVLRKWLLKWGPGACWEGSLGAHADL